MVTKANIKQSDAGILQQRRILRTRIRSFEQTEARRILGYRTQEMWDELRNSKTGNYAQKSLLV